jgi:transposase
MAIALRDDFDAARLRRLARRSGEPDQVRRLLALAAIYDGSSRADAAAVGGVTRQIVRDWVARFNDGGPDALLTRKAPGKASLLDAEQRAALVQAVEDGPLPATDGVVRWRLVDLCQWVWDRFAISVSRQTLGRELRALGYRKLSARPRHHAQAAGAVEAFKKASWPQWQRSRAPRAAMSETSRSGSPMKPG